MLRRPAVLVAATILVSTVAAADASPLRCQRTLVKESARYGSKYLQAIGACEARVARGRLPVSTDCTIEPITARKLASAAARLRGRIDGACGGSDRRCGSGGDDETPAVLGWPATCPDFAAAGCAGPIDDCGDIAACVQCTGAAAVRELTGLTYGALTPSDPRTERRLNRCQRALGAETVGLYKTQAQVTAQCWDARLRGKHDAACPEPGDGRTAARIVRAAASRRARVCQRCGGGRGCGAAGQRTPAEIGVPSSCPAVGGCDQVLVTLAGTIGCGRCVTAHTSACLAALAVPALAPYPPDCALAWPAPVCGDGVREGPEECDDGAAVDGDGCSAGCLVEDARGLCRGVPTHAGTTLAATLVASGLESPLHVTSAPLDVTRVFIVEQPGRVRLVRHDNLLPRPFLAIEDTVSCCRERGLLSLAFHPSYATNGRFFVVYTNRDGAVVLARYQVSADSDVADSDSGVVLLTIPQPASNHNGGLAAFGPDGRLYLGLGDGGGVGDPLGAGQRDDTLLGKLLRLDVDLDVPPYYAVPADNPNPGAGGPLGLIWAKGLRNPWRFGFDRATGELYIGDVGQDALEEVSVQPPGSGGLNYGWNVFEGTACYEGGPAFPTCPDPSAGFTPPVFEYTHAEGCSITGGFVYRGCRMPDLAGTYFYADFCAAFVRTFRRDPGGAVVDQADRTADLDPPGARTLDALVSFGEDARGELYVADLDGEVYRVGPGG